MTKEKIETGCKTIKTTAGNKTGSWRTFRPVITDKCKGCGICKDICPEGCIEMIEKGKLKSAKINYDYCKGCLICMIECPLKCIKKEEEKK